MMIEVYLAPTANCKRVSVMLECCELQYAVKAVDRDRKEHKTSSFLKMNPAGAVPVLVDSRDASGERVVLSQSGAILLYLAETSGRFMPSAGPARRRAQQAFMQVMTDVNPAASAYLLMNRLGQANQQTLDFFHGRLLTFLGHSDRMLADSPFLAGDMSIADIALFPVCDARRDVIDAADGLERLKAWMETMKDNAAVSRGMAAI